MSRRRVSRGSVIVLLTAILLLALPFSAALTANHVESLDKKVKRAGMVREQVIATDRAGAPLAALEHFRGDHGGHWWGRLHAGSGRAALISGSGLELAPTSMASLTSLEEQFRAIIAAHPDLLSPGSGELRVSPLRSLSLDEGDIAFVDFDWFLNGQPVRGARVFARVNHGRLIQLGTQLLGGTADPATPSLTKEQAIEAMFRYIGGRTEVDSLFGQPTLFYLPLMDHGALRYRLVWELAFRRGGEVPTWTARVAANDGEVLEFFDANEYGEVTGGVYQRTVIDEDIERPFPLAQVDQGPVSDRGGHFLYNGSLVSTELNGQFFNTNCEDGCIDPPQDHAASDIGLGWLRMGTGGVDAVGNGVSTKAERNSYYQLSLIRLLAKKWLSIGWLDTKITTNVNINDTCNAFWNGTANFYRSGGGCNNTGEIADVMQHEWGHGLDGNTKGGDSATGEGTADHVAFTFQHDPVIGPYFRTSGAGVRNLDKDSNSRGLLTRSNVADKCGTGSCSGPLGRECHCEGEIYGQTGWDLSQALVAKHGYHTGWQEFERIFFTSLPQAGSYLPDQPDAIYDAYLAVDDDDGNLANGTPNGQEIFDAFDTHGIAGSPVTSSPYCSRPAEPVVTFGHECGGVTLSWEAVPGATEYHVLRNPLSDQLAMLPVATVTGTSYTDTEAAPGYTYYYVVEAIDGTSCRSTIESVQAVTGPEKPLLGIIDVQTDDIPAGNRSGTVDPGEAVDLTLTLEDLSSFGGTGLVGQLASSTPGITVDIASQPFPDVAGFGTTANAVGFRFSLDQSVECGSDVDFTFTVTDDTGCAVDTQYFKVHVGVDEPRQSDTFETDNGWTFDAASSTATAGDWTRGIPDPTTYQPGSDSDDPGDQCWFTAPNAGGDGTDDVDDGEVILLSPIFDLSALSQATLSYQRWYANRDPGQDAGDYFWVQASSDGGTTWQTVELLDENVSEPAWTLVTFDLGAIIPLTDQVRFRVRVADGTDTGTIIEGAFDDFQVTEATCDDTPPCFVAPTFAGLESAASGPDCAENTLNWSAATSNCINAEITYDVYRSTTPGFTPADSNRVAEALTGLDYLDTLLQPGQDYHYVVRAYDSRSGEDGNLEERSALAPTSPDTKAPLFDGLAAADPGAGCGETVLSWNAAQETCSAPVVYHVYRSLDAGFTPAPENLIGETTDASLVDAALNPETDYHYIVQAVDQADLNDGNLVKKTVTATVLPEIVVSEDFEAGAAGWARSGLNDATTGLWELGDPDDTEAQPGDCPSGTSCWVTGLTGPGLGDNDVDGGTTTLLSELFDLTGMNRPAVRYIRYYSNNTGGAPAADTWTVEISSDDGVNWSVVEQTQVSDEGHVFSHIEYELPAEVTPTDQMRLRFTASDLADGSLVEAEVDDFETVDLSGGCDGCGAPPTVGTILLTRDGDDVVLDWADDPVTAGRYKIYTLDGPAFTGSTLLGTSASKGYRHIGGALYDALTSYRVSAVDECSQEGPLM